MSLLLGAVVGLIAAIIAVVILNKNKLFRTLGMFIAIACIVFLFNHDGNILKEVYRAYDNYGKEVPFILDLLEGFLEVFIFIFPIARIFAGFGNIVDDIEQNATVEQKATLNIIRVILVNLAKIFFR